MTDMSTSVKIMAYVTNVVFIFYTGYFLNRDENMLKRSPLLTGSLVVIVFFTVASV